MPTAFPQGIQSLFNLFPEGSLALVGGYVREWILNNEDVPADTEADFATTLTPQQSQTLLKEAGLLTDSPGLNWGTVTAWVEGTKYEITSTRTEVYSPNSRYPKTQYGATWQQDAARRDFTCNAIYLFNGSKIFDPFNGQQDLITGHIRFIGNPAAHLAEDPLRLLRYIRFSARYGTEGWAENLPFLQAALPTLASLTATRRQAEFTQLAALPTAIPLLDALGLAVDGTILKS